METDSLLSRQSITMETDFESKPSASVFSAFVKQEIKLEVDNESKPSASLFSAFIKQDIKLEVDNESKPSASVFSAFVKQEIKLEADDEIDNERWSKSHEVDGVHTSLQAGNRDDESSDNEDHTMPINQAVEKRHLCSICGKSFTRSCALQRHTRSIHRAQYYTCSVCGYVYSRADNLHRHIKLYHPTISAMLATKTPASSAMPVTETPASSAMPATETPASSATPVIETPASSVMPATETPASSAMPAIKIDHQTYGANRKQIDNERWSKSHEVVGVHKGLQAGSRDDESSDNEAHMMSTNQAVEKRYLCQTCGKLYTTSYALLRHSRTTHRAQYYNCPVCGYSFSRADGLQRHIKNYKQCCLRSAEYKKHHLQRHIKYQHPTTHATPATETPASSATAATKTPASSAKPATETPASSTMPATETPASSAKPAIKIDHPTTHAKPATETPASSATAAIKIDHQTYGANIKQIDNERWSKSHEVDGVHKSLQAGNRDDESSDNEAHTMSTNQAVEKRYLCPICGKLFTKSCALLRHTRTIHRAQYYNCPVCDHPFSRADTLQRHIKDYKQCCLRSAEYKKNHLQRHIKYDLPTTSATPATKTTLHMIQVKAVAVPAK